MRAIIQRVFHDPGLRFVFGQGSLQNRCGVYSLRRYAAPDPRLFLRRALKLLGEIVKGPLRSGVVSAILAERGRITIGGRDGGAASLGNGGEQGVSRLPACCSAFGYRS